MIDGEAVRVDTATVAEERRYVFAALSPAVASLAATIERPGIVVKVCAPLADLLAALPPGWRGQPQAYFMACYGPMRAPVRPLPQGYSATVEPDGPALAACITAADGSLAARGRAVAHDGLLVFDQIRTEAAHRRRGLGSHVMHTLAAGGDGRPVLTATAAGHALYTALGWTTLSLYSTAEREPAVD